MRPHLKNILIYKWNRSNHDRDLVLQNGQGLFFLALNCDWCTEWVKAAFLMWRVMWFELKI